MKYLPLLLLAVLVVPGRTAAQQVVPVTGEAAWHRDLAHAGRLVAPAPAPGTAYAAEAAGATAGSLLGFWIGYLGREGCEAEDLQCTLRKAGVAIGLGTVGAVAGDQLAGRIAGSDPSLLGAVLGALAGAAAGVGAWHLVTEELNLVNSPAAALATFALTQGLITAAGSRLARAFR